MAFVLIKPFKQRLSTARTFLIHSFPLRSTPLHSALVHSSPVQSNPRQSSPFLWVSFHVICLPLPRRGYLPRSSAGAAASPSHTHTSPGTRSPHSFCHVDIVLAAQNAQKAFLGTGERGNSRFGWLLALERANDWRWRERKRQRAEMMK